jgi:uncharacterized protein YabE (DUF348 family)
VNKKDMKKWLIGMCLVGGIVFFWYQQEERVFESEPSFDIQVLDGDFELLLSGLRATTVAEALSMAGVVIGNHDRVFPEKDARVFAGTRIRVVRGHELRVKMGEEERVFLSEAPSVEEALVWEGIALDEDDIVKPERASRPSENTEVRVTRVEIREESKASAIPFDTKVSEDAKLSWRTKRVTHKGVPGVKTSLFRVGYHDGKEVSRKLLQTKVTQEPESELITQGTFVQVGKSHRGAASWYAYTGTLSAANPWLPKGSSVRVTNMENGKSVIVVINDRGPFAPGRIIDLDRVAFMKIASLGTGVINVKMEEITN